MTNLTFQARPSAEDNFGFALQYDSRNYTLPFPFEGYALFINNDKDPFVTLLIKGKNIWNEKIDLTKHLKPGTYTLKLRTLVWTDPGNKTSAAFIFKVGSRLDGRVYPGPTPPPGPTNPFPEWEEYERYQKERDSKGFLQEYWDQWTVDYGV